MSHLIEYKKSDIFCPKIGSLIMFINLEISYKQSKCTDKNDSTPN